MVVVAKVVVPATDNLPVVVLLVAARFVTVAVAIVAFVAVRLVTAAVIAETSEEKKLEVVADVAKRLVAVRAVDDAFPSVVWPETVSEENEVDVPCTTTGTHEEPL